MRAPDQGRPCLGEGLSLVLVGGGGGGCALKGFESILTLQESPLLSWLLEANVLSVQSFFLQWYDLVNLVNFWHNLDNTYVHTLLGDTVHGPFSYDMSGSCHAEVITGRSHNWSGSVIGQPSSCKLPLWLLTHSLNIVWRPAGKVWRPQ